MKKLHLNDISKAKIVISQKIRSSRLIQSKRDWKLRGETKLK